jgi:hypothetical protein
MPSCNTAGRKPKPIRAKDAYFIGTDGRFSKRVAIVSARSELLTFRK